MRVGPPTMMILSMSAPFSLNCTLSLENADLASRMAVSSGSRQRWTMGPMSSSSLARFTVMVRCLGPAGVRRDEGQVDVGGEGAGQLHLGLFRRLPDSLGGHGVLLQIDAGLPHELLLDVVDERVVHVGAAELGISAGGDDLEAALLPHLHDGDVQRAAAEVEDQDLQLLARPSPARRPDTPRWAR